MLYKVYLKYYSGRSRVHKPYTIHAHITRRVNFILIYIYEYIVETSKYTVGVIKNNNNNNNFTTVCFYENCFVKYT